MFARNGKGMMKLVRLTILRSLLLKREILWLFESLKYLKDLYGWMASLAGSLPSSQVRMLSG